MFIFYSGQTFGYKKSVTVITKFILIPIVNFILPNINITSFFYIGAFSV